MATPVSKISFRESQIEMAHGAGGKASRRLVEGLFAPLLFGSSQGPLGDAAHIQINGTRIAMTTDSFVVKPLALSRRLHRGAGHQRHRERSRGVRRARGSDRRYLRSGSGACRRMFWKRKFAPWPGRGEGRRQNCRWRHQGRRTRQSRPHVYHHHRNRPFAFRALKFHPQSVRPGDKVLLSGPIGDHGITILLARGDLDLEAELRSDTRSVFPLVRRLVLAAGAGVRWMRDPTRGGVATSLNELARDCGHGIVLFEEKIPVRDSVRGACELLGLDPLHIANEGQFLAVVSSEHAEAALQALRRYARRRRSRNDRRSSRTTGKRGSGDDALRRKPHCRHARRRPVPRIC